jgi:hypothetical protein
MTNLPDGQDIGRDIRILRRLVEGCDYRTAHQAEIKRRADIELDRIGELRDKYMAQLADLMRMEAANVRS